MEKNMNARIMLKHDTEENWKKATGFIPKLSEPIVYDEDDEHSYKRYKIGDGVSNVNTLPFTRGIGQETLEGGEIFNDYVNNQAKGIYSQAAGEQTLALGEASTALGFGTVAEELGSMAMGYGSKTLVASEINLAERTWLEQDIAYCYIEGSILEINDLCIFTGNTSGMIVQGRVLDIQTEGPGQAIFFNQAITEFGENLESWKLEIITGPKALGKGSFAGGRGTKASSAASFAYGIHVSANKAGAAAFGKYNAYDANALLTVGDGTSSVPSNAFTVRSDSTNGASIVVGDTAITEVQLQALLALVNSADPIVTESRMQEYVNETILGGEW